MPSEALAKFNISSIAGATGLNRETARKNVGGLIAQGMLVRDDGIILLAPGFTQQQVVSSIVLEQLEELRRAANGLLRMGAFTVHTRAPAK